MLLSSRVLSRSLLLAFLFTVLFVPTTSAAEDVDPKIVASVVAIDKGISAVQTAIENSSEVSEEDKADLFTSVEDIAVVLTALKLSLGIPIVPVASSANSSADASVSPTPTSLNSPSILGQLNLDEDATVTGMTVVFGDKAGLNTAVTSDKGERVTASLKKDEETGVWSLSSAKTRTDSKGNETVESTGGFPVLTYGQIESGIRDIFQGVGKSFGVTDQILATALTAYLVDNATFYRYDVAGFQPSDSIGETCVTKTDREKMVDLMGVYLGDYALAKDIDDILELRVRLRGDSEVGNSCVYDERDYLGVLNLVSNN